MARESVVANYTTNVDSDYNKEYAFTQVELTSYNWSQMVLEVTIVPGSVTIKPGKTLRVNFAFSDQDGLTSDLLDSRAYFDVTLDADGGVTTSETINVTGDFLYTWYSTRDTLYDVASVYDISPYQVSMNAVRHFAEAGSGGTTSELVGSVSVNMNNVDVGTYSAIILDLDPQFSSSTYSFTGTFHPQGPDYGNLTLIETAKFANQIKLLFSPLNTGNGVVGTYDWRASEVTVADTATIYPNSDAEFNRQYNPPSITTYYVTNAGSGTFNGTYTYSYVLNGFTGFSSTEDVYVYNYNDWHLIVAINSQHAAITSDDLSDLQYLCDSNVPESGVWSENTGSAPAPTVSTTQPTYSSIIVSGAGNSAVNGTYYLKSTAAPVKNIFGTSDTFTCHAWHCETNGCWFIGFDSPSYANRSDIFLQYPHSTLQTEYYWTNPNPFQGTGTVGPNGVSTSPVPTLTGSTDTAPVTPTTSLVTLALVNQTTLGDGQVFGENRTLLSGTTLFRLQGNVLSSHSVSNVNSITNTSSVTVPNTCSWMVFNVAKTHIYLGGDNGAIYSYNVTNPASMTATGTISAIANCGFSAWAKVHGNYIYAAFSYPGLGGAGGFIIVDITTAASPSLVVTKRHADGNAGGGDVAIFGNYLVCGKYFSHYQQNETFVSVYDITTKSSPTVVIEKLMCYDTGDDSGFPTFESWQMHEYGDFLILTDDYVWQVWDMSTPAAPKYLRSLYPSNSSDTEGGMITPDGVIVSGINGGTHLTTIVLGANPPLTASYDNQLATSQGASSWYTYDPRGYLYGFIGGKLAVVSYSYTGNPALRTIANHTTYTGNDTNSEDRLLYDNNTLYVYKQSTRLFQVVDVTSPEAMSLLGSVTLAAGSSVTFLAKRSNYVFAGREDGTIVTITVTTPSSPTVSATFASPYSGQLFAWNWPVWKGNTLIAAYHYPGGAGAGSILFIDTTSPNSLSVQARFRYPSNSWGGGGLSIIGNTLYACDYFRAYTGGNSYGVHTIDVTTVTAPSLLNTVASPQGSDPAPFDSWTCFTDGNYWYVTDDTYVNRYNIAGGNATNPVFVDQTQFASTGNDVICMPRDVAPISGYGVFGTMEGVKLMKLSDMTVIADVGPDVPNLQKDMTVDTTNRRIYYQANGDLRVLQW